MATIVIPSASYPSGTKTAAEVAVPTGLSFAALSLSRNAWPDIGSDVLKFDCEISFDNGFNWTFFCRFTAAGGDVITNRDGVTVATASAIAFKIPQPENSQRRIRFTVETFATITTTITIDLN
jgi:hypothetical protein